MHDETDTIKILHSTYCGLSGQNITFTFNSIMWWNMWRSRGWTCDDLRFLIRYLQTKIRKGERNLGCLKFTNLIKDVDRFEEDLAMARSEARANERKPVYGERERILAAVGRPVQSTDRTVQACNVDWRKEWDKMKASISGGPRV